GIRPDVREQARAVGGETEEIVLLADPLRHGLMDGALSVHEVLLRVKPLAPDAVMAFVFPFVNVSRVDDRPEQRLDAADVPGLSGPDEIVIGDVEPLPDGL